MRAQLWLCVLAAALALACGDSKPPPTPPAISAQPIAAPPTTDGVLEGAVRLLEGTEPPAFAPDQMERKMLDHTKRGAWPDSCTPPKILDSVPMRATPDGKLSGVVVAVSDFKHAPKRPPRVHDAVIRDCRLMPSTIVAMKGDKLRVTTEVQFPFMPAYGPPAELKTLIPGQTYEVILDKLGSSPLTCGFMAPCGRTDVIVLSHPLAAVTDEKGEFRIDSFPAGERVTVTAWHPLLAESETQVELSAGETKRIELTAKPLPAAPSEPAPVKPEAKPGEPKPEGEPARAPTKPKP